MPSSELAVFVEAVETTHRFLVVPSKSVEGNSRIFCSLHVVVIQATELESPAESRYSPCGNTRKQIVSSIDRAPVSVDKKVMPCDLNVDLDPLKKLKTVHIGV